MKDQESLETLVARFPVVFIVEYQDNSADRFAAELNNLEISNPPASSNPVGVQSSQAVSLPGRSRRLAATRGFDNSGLQVFSQQRLVTPSSSPSKFLPAGRSTPLSLSPRRQLEDKLQGISASQRGGDLLSVPQPLPPDKTSGRLPPLPPRSSPVPFPALPLPKPTAIRVNVITPTATPEQSLDWDNFSETPSYRPVLGPPVEPSLDTANCLQEVSQLSGDRIEDQKITLVDTSESSLSSLNIETNMSRFQQQPSLMESHARAQIQEEMNQESRNLSSLHQDVLDMMEDYTEADVNTGNVDRVEGRLKEIGEARSVFRTAVRKYKDLYGTYGDSDGRLDSYIASLNQSVRAHANGIWSKVAQISPPMTQYERESLALQREQLQQQVSAPTRDRQAEGKLSLEAKKLLFKDELRFLTDSLSLPDYGTVADHWKEETEAEVSKAMRKLSEWERRLISISKAFREYEMLAKQYGESQVDLESNTEDYIEIRNKVREVNLAVQAEDDRRNLQTLQTSKSDKVSYPSFTGEAGDDLVRFKEKINDCFKKNRVPESDQLDKLRENLKGAALKRVPITVKKLAVAWQNLEEAFGSPLLVLKERLKSLSKIGNIPPDSTPAKQITWFHDFEAVLQDILDLGDSPDMNMQMGAFGPSVQEQVLKALTDNPVKKQEVAMAGSGKQPKDKMMAYKEKIVEYRRKTQLAEIESGAAPDKRVSKAQLSAPANLTFPSPQRNDSCRICSHLQTQNGHQNLTLFDKHLGNFPIHCPNFITMKMAERRKVAIKAKLCVYCLHPDIEYSLDHVKTCKDSKRKAKSSFTCISPGCSSHFWICTNHSEDNKSKLKDAAKNVSKHGLKLAFLGTLSLTTITSPEIVAATESLEKQVNKEMMPVPEGQPMFMFFGAKGKTRNLMVFFDSGCSRFIMRECIPGKELPASMVRPGPIPIGGVGGISVFASGEYLVAMDTIEGKAQQLQGVTVPVITGDFPTLDITAAVSAVQAGNRNNSKLRNCKFQAQVGGTIDCLIGIQYNQLQPKVVHMLPSGLAIYETKLSPHSKGMNFVLGGPHASFDFMLAKSGNASFLLNQFIAGLTIWRTSGPPSLTQHVMTEGEVDRATEMNMVDDNFEQFKELRKSEVRELEILLEDITANVELTQQHSIKEEEYSHLSEDVDLLDVSCAACGVVLLEGGVDDSVLYEDEKLSRLRHLIDKQETGVEISYRCVRCRDCLDCRNSEKIDKISLREESELYEIKKSVNIDWQNRRIICSLPLRGKERDFLSSNGERALKVLESQCKKYFKDNETKDTINAAFKKLIDKGYIVFLPDMTEDTRSKFQSKEVQYYLPWRIQFKPGSASTPARVVFDASSGTRRRKDGSGGRCLNDLVCKGPIDSMDLLRVVLRFFMGKVALAADFTKMYNQFALLPDQWNLQRILFKQDLDPSAPVQEACVTTLIYGVKSVAGQTEHTFKEVAGHIKDEKPRVARLLTEGRYVDNLLDSVVTKIEAQSLAEETAEVLDRLNLPTKGFSFSGEDPQPQETLDGVSIDINGMRWNTVVDSIEVKVPPLHFGNKRRGRVENAEYFEGEIDFAKMDAFVPDRLTRRMIVSKRAALYDSMGKLEPVKGMLKVGEREVVIATLDWDDPVASDVRNKWIKNFLMMEQLRGIRFTRARMPSTAVSSKMRLITLVDGAKELVMVACYCGFRVEGGGWSNQHLIGRSALGVGTVPRNELQALTGGSNLSWIVRMALPDWIESDILAGDSEIALHWTISDSRRLGEWHRNRVIQIRRGTDLSNIYYVGTDHNVADIGTRAEKVSIEDVGPDSRYENGDLWMRMELCEAVEGGFLRPASDLKPVPVEKEDDFKKGFLFEKEPEVLTRGHPASDPGNVSQGRLAKLEERALYSNYGDLLPTRRPFPFMVRVTGYVITFISKCRLLVSRRTGRNLRWSGPLLAEASLWFSAFPTTTMSTEVGIKEMEVWLTVNMDNSNLSEVNNVNTDLISSFSADLKPVSLAFFLESHSVRDEAAVLPTSKYLNAALLYYFRKASLEVIQFNSKVTIEKQTVMRDGVLLSKGRIIDGMNFLETADLDTLNLGSIGVKTMIPVIDRFSPLAYSIAQHIHWTVARHRGMETCLRMSLEHVKVLQGMSLFRELGENCIRCKIKRGRYIEASLGPLSDKQLIVAPPFYAVQVDLCGPCRIFVPGYEKETRATKVKESKVWIFVSVCLVTSNVNLQVCEMKDTAAILEAIIRLACEVGYPKYIAVDKEGSILAAMREIQVNLRDLQHSLYREHGVLIEEAAVGGHDQHGKVERTIRSIQDSMEDMGLSKMRIHAMGLQTICKQVENSYNNLPLGYRYERDQDNTRTLKMLVPNMLKTGRINSRALDGPVKLSNDSRKMLGQIQEKFEAWYKVWAEVYVPKIMAQKRGFKNDRDLAVDDLVYYKKRESELGSHWVIGRVDQVIRGRDGVIRRAVIKYRNASEDIQRETERSVRKLIRLYSADDPDLYQDLGELQRRIDQLQDQLDGPPGVDQQQAGLLHGAIQGLQVQARAGQQGIGDLVEVEAQGVQVGSHGPGLQGEVAGVLQCGELKCQCCCQAHCKVFFHNCWGTRAYQAPTTSMFACQLQSRDFHEVEYSEKEEVSDEETPDPDDLTTLIMSVGLNLD